MNFYPRYVGDFQRDTSRLSLVEIGIYDRLLDDYYAQEQPFPAELDAACSVCRARTPSERAATLRVLNAFFPVADDGLRHNKRADEEIVKGRERIEKARNNGKHGGRPTKPSGLPDKNPAGLGNKPSGLTPHLHPHQEQLTAKATTDTTPKARTILGGTAINSVTAPRSAVAAVSESPRGSNGPQPIAATILRLHPGDEFQHTEATA